MMSSMFGVRARLWRRTVRVLAAAPTDRLMDTMFQVQKTRAWMEDVQDGMLHLAALPTRQDIRRLQRSVDALRRRAGQLDLAVAALERDLADIPAVEDSAGAPSSSRVPSRAPE